MCIRDRPLLLGALWLTAPLAQANPTQHQFDYRVRSAPAVSYTHLDVYKRQARYSPKSYPRQSASLARPHLQHVAPIRCR